jgi:hypothetical protein
MKKGMFLIMALLALGLTAVYAQNDADIKAMQQLTADFQAGKITIAEFQRQVEAIQQRMTADMQAEAQNNQRQPQQQAQPRQGIAQGTVIRTTFPGATAGWPAASAFRRFGITLSQPTLQTLYGVTYSYKVEGEKLTIYIAKNMNQDDIDSLVNTFFTDQEKQIVLNQVGQAFGVSASEASAGTIQDPTKKSTAAIRYVIDFRTGIEPDEIIVSHALGLAEVEIMSIKIETRSYDPRGPDKG